MSDDVEKCEDNVESGQCRRREWDCNSSSGGSVYQDFHGRQEEMMYSTDDEFLDATETIRSPLLAEDPEEQLSAPVLKQLRQEKEHTRYIVVDMVTDCESVNNIREHCKQNFDTIVELPCGETDSDCCKREPHCVQSSEGVPSMVTVSSDQQSITGSKPEKSKCSRTLRLPSSIALPTVKPDRPARGDGRPPVGVSKIPIPVSSMTKLQQISTTPEQNTSESESCPVKPSKQTGSRRKSYSPIQTPEKDRKIEGEVVPECLNAMASSIPEPDKPPNSGKPPSRASSKPSSKQSARPSSRAVARPLSALPKEDKMDIGNENLNSSKESPTKEEACNPPVTPEKLIISKAEEPPSCEKPRNKRARSKNKSVEGEQDIPIDTRLVNSTNERAETKRMRVSNKPPSREEPEKRFTKSAEPPPKDRDKRKREIQAVRDRLAKDRLNLINSREKEEVISKQSQMVVDNSVKQKAQDPVKSENTQKSTSRKSENNDASLSASRVQASPSNVGSEKNTAMHEKVPSSPRQLSPMVMNMTIVEKRRQLRQSREVLNGDFKSSTKNLNMPEIKPPLFKSNQLKTNQLGQRHQENVPNAPMKSALEDESLRKKTTLVEKRKMIMKQKEAINNANKPATSEVMAQRTGKVFERTSREKPPLPPASHKRSNSDIRKPLAVIPKSTEKIASLNSSFAMQDVQEESNVSDVQGKLSTTSTNSKVTLASMQNVYKMHYKRCEEQLNEVKRAKGKLGMSLEKLETLRSQMIMKFGEDTEEFIPPVYVVENLQNSSAVMTTAKGMNTEVLEEVAESLVLLGNNQQLKQDIESLRMQLEEAKEIGNANKKDDDVILDLKQRIREMSLTLTLAEKRQETLEDNMEEKQKEILSLSNENKEMNDLFRQRDQQLSALRKQIEEKNRELESYNKKLVEANNKLQEELCKSEVNQMEHQKLIEEKSEIQKELQEMEVRFADFEEREECLNTILENEKKKTKMLEELLSQKEEELNSMEKKFFEMESSSSTNMLVANDKLHEKDLLIRDLEIMKTTFQGHITELCCLFSDLFALRGIEYNIDHIQASLSAGSLSLLRDELLKVMEEQIEEGNKALNESRSKMVELQNQVKILQIELEDTKMMSERFTSVITHQKPWDADKPWDEHQRPWSSDMASARHTVHNNLIENSVRDNKGLRDRDMHSLMPALNNSFVCPDATMASNNFNELFILLERKRRQLLQLERKYQDMEEVHSHCAQKRTRNETRIAQLEMMLAKLKNQESVRKRNLIYLSGELGLHYKGVDVTQLEIVFDDV